MSDSIRFHEAGRVDDVPAGSSRLVRVAGQPVLLAHWQGRIYAFASVCPHRNNPLEGAQVFDGQLQCPWHHFRYDLETGDNVYPRNVYPLGAGDVDQQRLEADVRPLQTFPVELRNGSVFVGFPAAPAESAANDSPGLR